MFIDIKMPRLNGFEVLQWLKDHQDCKVIPTMVFSSSEHPEDIERAYQLGANAYLVKPNSTENWQTSQVRLRLLGALRETGRADEVRVGSFHRLD